MESFPRARQLARMGKEMSREGRARLDWMDYYLWCAIIPSDEGKSQKSRGFGRIGRKRVPRHTRVCRARFSVIFLPRLPVQSGRPCLPLPEALAGGSAG